MFLLPLLVTTHELFLVQVFHFGVELRLDALDCLSHFNHLLVQILQLALVTLEGTGVDRVVFKLARDSLLVLFKGVG